MATTKIALIQKIEDIRNNLKLKDPEGHWIKEGNKPPNDKVLDEAINWVENYWAAIACLKINVHAFPNPYGGVLIEETRASDETNCDNFSVEWGRNEDA